MQTEEQTSEFCWLTLQLINANQGGLPAAVTKVNQTKDLCQATPMFQLYLVQRSAAVTAEQWEVGGCPVRSSVPKTTHTHTNLVKAHA